MKRYTTRTMNPEQLRLALQRPAIDEVDVGDAVTKRLHDIFGEALTPKEAVLRIVQDVEAYGDTAVIDYTEKIDGVRLDATELFVDEAEVQQARRHVEPDALAAIRHAIERVRRFHEAQVERSWFQTGPDGEIVGQRILPLERVCCYVPGGRAALASTAIMSVVPARVAGVDEIVVATPPTPEGTANPYIVTAAKEAGAHRILKVGGAQAVASVAFGTTWIPKVDKIVGPGNVFVTLAKKEVFGRVGIDGLNGPSEIVVVADDMARASWVAADLLSQAEHDPDAAAIVLTTSETFADEVERCIEKQLVTMERADVARASLKRWGAVVVCRTLEEACTWVNHLAPEHVELIVADPWSLAARIRFAGALFLGGYSTEPIGDYIAGPNHVLPTNGTARFASPLGVYDFVRRSSMIAYNEEALTAVAEDGIRLAELEGLGAHAEAIRRRFQE